MTKTVASTPPTFAGSWKGYADTLNEKKATRSTPANEIEGFLFAGTTPSAVYQRTGKS